MNYGNAKKRTVRAGLICAAVSVFVLIGVISDSNLGANNTTDQKRVEIRLGEASRIFASRTAGMTNVDKQPAGLDFHTIRWPMASLGSVAVKQGTLSLHIDNVISVTGTKNDEYPEEGLSKISINAAITRSE